MTKISWEDACEIRLKEARGMLQKEIADEYGISQRYVSKILCWEAKVLPPEPKQKTAEKITKPCRRCKGQETGPRGICNPCRDEIVVEQSARKSIHAKKRCEVCGTAKLPYGRLTHCVDHNHETGEFRGALCGNCNNALGLAGDNPVILERLSAYLRNYGFSTKKSVIS